jgi:hypothetical protein
MRAITLLLLSSALLGAQPAALDGVAINDATGEPLPGVHIRLVTGMFEGGVTDAYGGMTGRDGRFSIAGLKPGFYLVLPERTGFVSVQKDFGALPFASLTFKSGEHVSDYKLKMTPRAVIQGRVVDENGDPVPFAQVEPVPVDKDAPVAMRLTGPAWARTDDRGEFRISGGPGKFHLKATPQRGPGGPAPENRADGSTEAVYGVTFYPSAATADRAAPVEAVSGRDVSGIEIRLLRQRNASITGIVSGAPPGNVNAMVMLRWGDSADRLYSSTSNQAGPDGRFRFQPVPAAQFYQVSATYAIGNVRLRSQNADVRLDGDAAEVHLQLAAGGELAGSIEIAGDAPGTPVEKRTIQLEFTTPQFNGPLPSVPIQDDGSFRLTDVFAGKYRVKVQPMPENGYIKSVTLDGAAQGATVDLTRGGSRLKLVLSRNAARISGTVLDKDGKPLVDTLAIVLLVQDLEHLDDAKNERVDSGGRYSFQGVAPGKYRLLAFDALRSGAMRGEDEVKKVLQSAEEIEIHEAEQLKKDLHPVTKEDADAKAKQ